QLRVQHGWLSGRIIVADLWRLEGGAAGKRRGEQYQTTCLKAHQPSSFDQLMAWTNTPSGFLRRRSASCGVSITTVRIAVQRSVAARLAFSSRRSIQATRRLSFEARMTLEISVASSFLPSFVQGSCA